MLIVKKTYITTMFSLERLLRPNILQLKPYSSARDEYKGVEAHVFLDANENPFNVPVNRYPDPLQWQLKEKLSVIKGVRPECIFLGNGSDEAIDLVFRAFCRPGIDNVVAIDPTYGMYQVCADINDVAYRKVLLDEHFQFHAEELIKVSDEFTKAIFLCSPNNPTGNNMCEAEIEELLARFEGIVVIDEAYFDFSDHATFSHRLGEFPNLIVLQTFSKAWGCAAIRLGMAFASEEIIAAFNKIKYPYNVNQLTQQEALKALENVGAVKEWVRVLRAERGRLMDALKGLPVTERVFETDANFVLVRVTDAVAIYDYLVGRGIIVRNRHRVSLCDRCLRITVGTPEENDELLEALKAYHETENQ